LVKRVDDLILPKAISGYGAPVSWLKLFVTLRKFFWSKWPFPLPSKMHSS